MRVDLAACYRLVAHYGMDDMFATHISARVPGAQEHFLLNPYGVLFEQITASDLVKVDLDGNIVQDTQYTINPAGFVIHSAVHAARPDAKCVLHTHTVAGMAVASTGGGASAAHPEVDALLQPHRLSRLRRRRRRPRRARAAGRLARQAQCADPAQPRPAHLRPDGGARVLPDAQPREELPDPDRRHVDRRQADQALAQPDGARRRASSKAATTAAPTAGRRCSRCSTGSTRAIGIRRVVVREARSGISVCSRCARAG